MAGSISRNGTSTTTGPLMHIDVARKSSYPRSGNTIFDISGNSNNGTIIGIDSSSFRDENSGSLFFNGTSSYIEFSDVPFRITNYNLTLEITFYFNGNNIVAPHFVKRKPDPNYSQISSFIGDGNAYAPVAGKVLTIFLRDDNSNSNASNDRVLTYTLPGQGVYHYMVTNSSTQSQLWVNGSLVSTSTSNLVSGNFTISGYNLRIGWNGLSNYWNDKIYMSRFYNRLLSNSEIVQNYNSVIYRFLPKVTDPDAQAFINIAILNKDIHANAINNLVIDLKNTGLWTKMRAIYPVVGGNAWSHKFNLKDINNYNLLFFNTWTHTTDGMLPSSAYADTSLSTSAIGLNSVHLSYYSSTNSSISGQEMGALQNTPNSYTDLGLNYPGYGAFVRINNGGLPTGVVNNDSTGFYVGNRTSASVLKIFKNGSIIRSGTDPSNATSTRPIYIGGLNNQGTAGFFTNRRCLFSSIGEGLTDTESANFYTIVQTYQTALGRQV